MNGATADTALDAFAGLVPTVGSAPEMTCALIHQAFYMGERLNQMSLCNGTRRVSINQ